MAQYLVAIYLPDDFDPSSADKSMEHDIDVLNEEMEAKGVRLFAGGLRPARDAKALRVQRDGKVLITDGPYLETKEHVGGFWRVRQHESAGIGRHHQHLPARRTFADRHHGRLGVATSEGGLK
jgi:hypothetical protein